MLQPLKRKTEIELVCPLMGSDLSAGFPSPAQDYVEEELDLNKYMIHHPTATYFMRVAGDSMHACGIYDGDIVVVDRALSPKHNKIIVAALNGELLIKRLLVKNFRYILHPENTNYPDIIIDESDDFSIWGVVTFAIHNTQTL